MVLRGRQRRDFLARLIVLGLVVLAPCPRSSQAQEIQEFPFPGQQGKGVTVHNIPDVNGDGIEDLLVSVERKSPSECGKLQLHLSIKEDGTVVNPTLGFETNPAWTFQDVVNPVTGMCSGSGLSVASVGDMNGDGLSEIAVGSPDCALPGNGDVVGCVRIFQGASRSFQPSPTIIYNSKPFSQFGLAVDAGDFNNDGKLDLVVASPGGTLGWVHIYLNNGGAFSSTPDRTITSTTQHDNFAYAIAVGDLDGNGLADLLVGAPARHNGAGAIVIAWDGLADQTQEVRPTGTGGRYGFSIAVADTDDDKSLDVFIGAPFEGNGRVHVYNRAGSWSASRVTDLFQPDVIAKLEPGSLASLTTRFGTSLRAVGDIDSDGFADIVIGSSEVGCNGVADHETLALCGNGQPSRGTNFTRGIVSGDGWQSAGRHHFAPTLELIQTTAPGAAEAAQRGVMCCVNNDKPVVLSVSPTTLSHNDSAILVTITGQNLGRSLSDIQSVTTGGVPCADVKWVNSTRIQCSMSPRPRHADERNASFTLLAPVVTTSSQGKGVHLDTAVVNQTFPLACPGQCSNIGRCNDTGHCVCPLGRSGADCSTIESTMVCGEAKNTSLTLGASATVPSGEVPAGCTCLPGWQGTNCSYSVVVQRETTERAKISEAGGRYTYTLSLTEQPTAPVTVSIVSSPACMETELSFSLFEVVLATSVQEELIQVIGRSDNVADNDTVCNLTTRATSADKNYDGYVYLIDAVTVVDVIAPTILELSPAACPTLGCTMVVTVLGADTAVKLYVNDVNVKGTTLARQQVSLLQASPTISGVDPTRVRSQIEFNVPAGPSIGYTEFRLQNPDGGSTTTSIFRDSAEALKCGAGTSYNANTGNCDSCPPGAVCPGGSRVYPQEGSLVMPGTNAVIPCTPKDRCGGVGPNGEMLCGPGYDGPTCSDCAPSYFEVEGSCTQCAGGGDAVFLGLLLVYMGFGLLFILAIFFARQNVLETFVEALMTIQFLSTLGASSAYNLPPLMKEAESYMRLLSFNSSFLRYGCFEDGYVEPTVSEIFITNIGTYGLMVCLFMMCLACMLPFKRFTRDYLFTKLIRGHVVLWAAFFSLLSNSAFPVVHCVELGGARRVAVALTQVCDTGTHLYAEIGAYILLFCQAGSIALASMYVFKKSEEEREEPKNVARYGYLYHGFKESARWTNLVFFSVLFTTAALEVLATQHQTAVFAVQIGVMSLLVIALLVFQPFKERMENVLVAVTMVLSCTVLTAKYLSSTGSGDEQFHYHYGRATVLIAGLIVLSWISLMAWKVYQNHKERSRAIKVKYAADEDEDVLKLDVIEPSLDSSTANEATKLIGKLATMAEQAAAENWSEYDYYTTEDEKELMMWEVPSTPRQTASLVADNETGPASDAKAPATRRESARANATSVPARQSDGQSDLSEYEYYSSDLSNPGTSAAGVARRAPALSPDNVSTPQVK